MARGTQRWHQMEGQLAPALITRERGREGEVGDEGWVGGKEGGVSTALASYCLLSGRVLCSLYGYSRAPGHPLLHAIIKVQDGACPGPPSPLM